MLFAFDFVPDTNVPLINSGGKIELTPIGQQSVTINVPTTSQTTSDGFWIMGKKIFHFSQLRIITKKGYCCCNGMTKLLLSSSIRAIVRISDC